MQWLGCVLPYAAKKCCSIAAHNEKRYHHASQGTAACWQHTRQNTDSIGHRCSRALHRNQRNRVTEVCSFDGPRPRPLGSMDPNKTSEQLQASSSIGGRPYAVMQDPDAMRAVACTTWHGQAVSTALQSTKQVARVPAHTQLTSKPTFLPHCWNASC